MKRIESFLRQNSQLCWLLKAIIVASWILLPTGILESMLKSRTEGAEKNRRYSIEVTERAQSAVNHLAESLAEQAKRAGPNYGPKRYFADLTAIYSAIETHRQKTGQQLQEPLQVSLVLNGIMSDNIKARRVSPNEVQLQRKQFDSFLDSTRSQRNEALRALQRVGPTGVCMWFIHIYCWSLLLVLLLYLLRMSERRGVLETILADKRRLFLAIVLWPLYLTRYPSNVLREVRVEAELRRLGRLFRVFKPDERELVRKIANSSEYKAWLGRKRSCGRMRRSLALALLVAVLMNLLLPAFARADSKTISPSATRCSVSQLHDGPDPPCLTDGHGGHFGVVLCPIAPMALPEPVSWLLLEPSRQVVPERTTLRLLVLYSDIKHIPLLDGWTSDARSLGFNHRRIFDGREQMAVFR